MRPGNVLVAVRNPNRLQHLERILQKTDTRKMDIVVLSVRQRHAGRQRASTRWNRQQMFSDAETTVFTQSGDPGGEGRASTSN